MLGLKYFHGNLQIKEAPDTGQDIGSASSSSGAQVDRLAVHIYTSLIARLQETLASILAGHRQHYLYLNWVSARDIWLPLRALQRGLGINAGLLCPVEIRALSNALRLRVTSGSR